MASWSWEAREEGKSVGGSGRGEAGGAHWCSSDGKEWVGSGEEVSEIRKRAQRSTAEGRSRWSQRGAKDHLIPTPPLAESKRCMSPRCSSNDALKQQKKHT